MVPLGLIGVVLFLLGVNEGISVVVFVITLLSHLILYTCFRWYRYRCELEAYKVQLKQYDPDLIDFGATVDKVVNLIFSRYDLDLSKTQIEQEVQGWILH